jgi:hypothetical protein
MFVIGLKWPSGDGQGRRAAGALHVKPQDAYPARTRSRGEPKVRIHSPPAWSQQRAEEAVAVVRRATASPHLGGIRLGTGGSNPSPSSGESAAN